MDLPTATQVRSWAPPLFDWGRFGVAPVTAPAEDPLDVRVGWAVGELYTVTGRTLASITAPEEEAVAQKVLAALTIAEAVGGGQAALDALEQPWIKSFTAGSYSETRFSPAELGADGRRPPYPIGLWTLLWGLMTPEMQDMWRERLNGVPRPAGVLIEPDWTGFGWLEHGDFF